MERLVVVDDLALKGFLPSAYGDVEVDWLETDDAHIFNVNLPGLRKDDINVQVLEGNILQISGLRKDGAKALGKWHSLERSRGSFLRQFKLPSDVRVDEIKAYEDEGVVTIIVPKKKPVVRKIHISKL